MIFFRIDKDGIPDDQSYYDWQGARKELLGHWYTENIIPSTKTREEALKYFSGIMSTEVLDLLLVKTEHGWQLSTPPNTLFGVMFDPENIKNILAYPSCLPLYFKEGSFFQVWEGTPVSDRLRKRIKTPPIHQDGYLFIPKRFLSSYKIPVTPSEFKLLQSLEPWMLSERWGTNPFQ